MITANPSLLSSCIIEKGINNYDTKEDILHQVVSSQQACADLCASTPGGHFWTWNRDWNQLCNVKRSSSGRVSDAGVVSGNRQCGSGEAKAAVVVVRQDVLKKNFFSFSVAQFIFI